jgi:hypothetical protein
MAADREETGGIGAVVVGPTHEFVALVEPQALLPGKNIWPAGGDARPLSVVADGEGPEDIAVVGTDKFAAPPGSRTGAV